MENERITENNNMPDNAREDPGESRQWIAEQIMAVTRDRLLEELPYMNRALLRMPVTFYGQKSEEEQKLEAGQTSESRQNQETGKKSGDRPQLPPGIGTDGRLIYADAETVIREYQENKIKLARIYLHMILHCLFQHPFHYTHMDRARWDLAADIAVEETILELDESRLTIDEDWAMRREIDVLKQEVGDPFTAEHIYRWLKPYMKDESLEKTGGTWLSQKEDAGQSSTQEKSGQGQSWEEKIASWQKLFHRDIHETWLFVDEAMPEEVIRRGGDETGGRWRSISQGVQRDMEMHEKNQSLDPGSLTRVIHAVYEKEHSYADFLKQFAKLSEDMHINSEEFDYIYYMYGLHLYGRMPLIEPLEYRETDRIRDFVIAIDTSGSCQGHIVEGFLHRTWDILKEAGIFTGQLNLHIIQADSKIQRDDVIRSQEDFNEYMKDVTIAGSGGTDFRPVFEHVDLMIRNGEFPHLQGLLYFTDGYGIFPTERPEYPVAFVFVRDQWEIPKVPAWAYQIVLEPEKFDDRQPGSRMKI
ncbi:MAG: VWA-like domain-containing protein [Eubacteriales bacterium]|jgi:predicted metal-dependent peptidase